MSKQYDNTNTGVLFPESEKETESHPDYTGKIDVNGTEYRLVGWLKQSRQGSAYVSLSVSEFKGS